MFALLGTKYCLRQLQTGEAAIYTTSRNGKRFERRTEQFQLSAGNSTTRVTIDPSHTYQTIIGFGGAFTDSAGVNMNRLSANARQNLLKAYFSEEGIGYNLARVIMASCDFSPRVYSYDDLYADPLQGNLGNLLGSAGGLILRPTDFELEKFNLTSEDFTLKLPHIKTALKMAAERGDPLKLFASPFSAPAWMKLTGFMEGGGPLLGDVTGPYYKTWAEYFVRFFEEYAKEGVEFWGLTMQNEPLVSAAIIWWQGTFFTAEMQRDFLKLWLGPALKNSSVAQNVKVMIMDDQRTFLPEFPNTVLSDPGAAQYVDGIGVHWYFDIATDPQTTLVATHDDHPDIFLLGTEASQGYLPGQAVGIGGPLMGDWNRGINYADNIIQDMQNWVAGWTEWNLCLDEQGGPTWVTTAIHGLDSTIIVNNTVDEFYKQPTYYVIGHFSKFVPAGSVRVDMAIEHSPLATGLDGLAFINPANHMVLVLHNKNALVDFHVSIEDTSNPDAFLQLDIEALSIVTVVWRN
ncbi:glycosyl hydrolase family 30 TIM-barrel domain-containing protein [Ditylenchus destructor]|uniref:Glucosylceramidase n=1 Tax=Ditylenchus destructor TaxID=166010 RepID=A0AAD4MJK8_9BILA|nr:glycosyl hydrolase family 30 TIM-barrel domain-containing protein [Ditylenchus destructor]